MNKRYFFKVFIKILPFLYLYMLMGCKNVNKKDDSVKIKIVLPTSSTIKSYKDSVGNKIKAKHISISINTKESLIIFEGKKFNFDCEIQDLFKVIGKPDRYIKSITSSYIFDSLGFYINANSINKLSDLSMEYIKNPLTIPKNAFDQELIIDGQKITIASTPEVLKKTLNIKPYGVLKNSFVKRTNSSVIYFDYTEENDKLSHVYILIKKWL